MTEVDKDEKGRRYHKTTTNIWSKQSIRGEHK